VSSDPSEGARGGQGPDEERGSLPDPDDPATDAVVARHVATLPGWAARWDARVLAQRERLRHRSPRTYRLLLGVMATGYLLVDAVVPRRRVVPVMTGMVVMTVADGFATYLWVTRAVAVEGNPLVDAVIGALGEGPGLALRTVLSVLFVLSLGWLATRHWEARGGLVLAGAGLLAVTGVHLYGAVLVLTA
jgi:hypothetical protein